jgi:Ca2+:H+ antiporter
LGKIAYGTTALLAVVVVVEILHAQVLVIFALTSLALIGLAWVLGQATEALGHHAGPRIGGICPGAAHDLRRHRGPEGRRFPHHA